MAAWNGIIAAAAVWGTVPMEQLAMRTGPQCVSFVLMPLLKIPVRVQ